LPWRGARDLCTAYGLQLAIGESVDELVAIDAANTNGEKNCHRRINPFKKKNGFFGRFSISPVILANEPQKICINLNFLPMNSTYPRSIPAKFHVSKHGASLDNLN
jgi:hypothetical protein